MDSAGILNQVVSHASSLGLFEQVNQHEPKNAPGNGLTCSIWVERIGPLPAASGLAQTTTLVTLNARVYTSMLQQPYDAIDTNILTAVDTLINAYSGSFTLGGAVRDVDVLGQFGTGLSAVAGYLNQDNKVYRVMTLTIPLVVNDVWDQVP